MQRGSARLLVGLVLWTLVGCASQQRPATMPQPAAQRVDESKPMLLTQQGDNYYVYRYKGRIYVLGSNMMSQQFAQQGHVPYSRTVLGAGPQGETVVYEVKNDDPTYADRLMKQYQAK